MDNPYETEGAAFRELRIKAGFSTMRSACDYTDTPYRTWQNWELGVILAPNIADRYLELLIATRQKEAPHPT